MLHHLKLYIGSNVFVQVAWSVATLVDKVQFVLDTCWVKQEAIAENINIVEGNCYAAVIGAKIIGDHLVTQKAQFR